MHSISESDGILSDPYEVLCCMGTLIIEGRTPKAIYDLSSSGESIAKSLKPYNEGPHCPNYLKTYAKDAHKCTDKNILCIRYNNLRQHLQYLHCVSPSIVVEVSLGPDCLCGELRSQSTLVSTQSSKRDAILEQWIITIKSKHAQEPSSAISVLSVYQAVRSLLHFSQLTAWYMNTNGTKPSHVIYRVVTLEEAAYIADDDFISHDLPLVDVNKSVSLKITLKTLPRKEKIPSVFCPRHSSLPKEGSTGGGPPFGEHTKEFLYSQPLHSNFGEDDKVELLSNSLPLKFQGVRKKTNEAQERKRKKHILYNSSSSVNVDDSSGSEILDGMPVDVRKVAPSEDIEILNSKRVFPGKSSGIYSGETSEAEFKKSKPFSTEFSKLVGVKHDFEVFSSFTNNFLEQKIDDSKSDQKFNLNSLSDFKAKNDFRTKNKAKIISNETIGDTLNTMENKSVMDILDDRMQISCAISGKHHCKWECDEESEMTNPGGNVEKPKRRRSLSRAKVTDVAEGVKLVRADCERILHGKFKEVDTLNDDISNCLQENNIEAKSFCEEKLSRIDNIQKSSKPFEFYSGIENGSATEGAISKHQSSSSNSLSESNISEKAVNKLEIDNKDVLEQAKRSQENKDIKSPSTFKWVRKESFESFRRGCDIVSNIYSDYYSSDSESETSESHCEASNPFLAAILRTTKRSKASGLGSKSQKKCDNVLDNKFFCENKSANSDKSYIANNSTKDSTCIKKPKDSFRTYLAFKNKMESKTKAEKSSKSHLNKNSTEVICCEDHRRNINSKLIKKKSNAFKDFYEGVKSEENLESSKVFTDDQKETSPYEKKQHFNGKIVKCLQKDSKSDSINTKTIPVPSAHDKLKFRRSLDSAAQLVFHRCSGLPLTSSPAPVRRNNSSFSYDSSLNSVSAIKSALFEPSNSLSSEDENESEGSLKSPASPGAWSVVSKQINYLSLSPLPLLGSFEESVLNGRLEPVSTVQGFTAELGASGSFCPRHLHLPVTVFFYTLGDNDKVSAPYLGHINLGKKGYNVPRSGTIQVTLFNPLRTVVKMFVVVYDLSDMPVNSHTFLRQRTLYVPASQKYSTSTDKKDATFDTEDYHKYLRYLIHLRFVSGKTGRIYLHTDIRMVIFRKADEDTATAIGKQIDGETYELRSHTHGPINPKFSPRK